MIERKEANRHKKFQTTCFNDFFVYFLNAIIEVCSSRYMKYIRSGENEEEKGNIKIQNGEKHIFECSAHESTLHFFSFLFYIKKIIDLHAHMHHISENKLKKYYVCATYSLKEPASSLLYFYFISSLCRML